MSERARLLPGVFLGSHAVAEGLLTKQQLRTRSYSRLVQGVYADPGLDFDHRLRCRGVALLLPRGFAIGGHSAAAWHGAPFAGALDHVTVVGPADGEWKGPRGVRVHRSQTAFDVVRDADDVPVTSPLRTAWDTAALESLGTGVAALDAMVRTGAVRGDELTAMTLSNAGRWGVAKVRRAVELVDPRAESPPESRVRVALVLAGLSPVPQFDVFDGGEWLGRVDLAMPEAKIAVEYEGAYHFEDGADRSGRRPIRPSPGGWLDGHPAQRRRPP